MLLKEDISLLNIGIVGSYNEPRNGGMRDRSIGYAEVPRGNNLKEDRHTSRNDINAQCQRRERERHTKSRRLFIYVPTEVQCD